MRAEGRNEEGAVVVAADIEALVLSLDVVLEGQVRGVGVGGQGEFAIGVSNVVKVTEVVDGSEDPVLVLCGTVISSELDGASDGAAEGIEGDVSALPEDGDLLSGASEDDLLAERSIFEVRVLALIVGVDRRRRKTLDLRLSPKLRVERKSVLIEDIGRLAVVHEVFSLEILFSMEMVFSLEMASH